MVFGPDGDHGRLVNVDLLNVQYEHVLVHDRHHTVNISFGDRANLEFLGRPGEVVGSSESDGWIEDGAARVEFVPCWGIELHQPRAAEVSQDLEFYVHRLGGIAPMDQLEWDWGCLAGGEVLHVPAVPVVYGDAPLMHGNCFVVNIHLVALDVGDSEFYGVLSGRQAAWVCPEIGSEDTIVRVLDVLVVISNPVIDLVVPIRVPHQ